MAEHWVQGFLSAGLFSERGKNLRNLDLTPKGTQRFEHGKSYMIVVTNPSDMADRVNKVSCFVDYKRRLLNSLRHLGRAELVARDECSRTAHVVSLLVQRSSLCEVDNC